MIKVFRHAWVSQYGEVDDGTWRAVVAQLDAAEVRRGLELCHGHWEGDFPPRPAQFLKMARIPAAQRVIPRDRRLTVKPARPEVVAESLATLREILA